MSHTWQGSQSTASTHDILFFNNNFPEICTGLLQLLIAGGRGTFKSISPTTVQVGLVSLTQEVPRLEDADRRCDFQEEETWYKCFLEGFHSIY